ncbi:MAG: hypothetical protein WAN82_00115 [Candidatus Bathyarchaeia archaeon]
MHIELIATDGTTQRRILWVDVTSNSVCSGMCKEKADLHTTYHFDGNVFSNMFGEKPKKMYVMPPFEDLRGRHQLSCMVFTSDLARLHDTPLYKFKKLDALVSIDVRAYKRGIGCMLFMVERNRHDVLGELGKDLPTGLVTEIHSFLTCRPWISLVLYGGVYKDNTIS